MEKKEYNKTWYWKWTWYRSPIPENFISGTPVRLFGYTLGAWWKVAKYDYPWVK